MFKLLMNGLLSVLTGLINIILLPINALVEALFPNSIINAIGNFNTFVSTYLGGALGWFGNLFPPIFKSLVVIALTFMIGYFTFVWTYTAIVKIWNVIQKIKFW